MAGDAAAASLMVRLQFFVFKYLCTYRFGQLRSTPWAVRNGYTAGAAAALFWRAVIDRQRKFVEARPEDDYRWFEPEALFH